MVSGDFLRVHFVNNLGMYAILGSLVKHLFMSYYEKPSEIR